MARKTKQKNRWRRARRGNQYSRETIAKCEDPNEKGYFAYCKPPKMGGGAKFVRRAKNAEKEIEVIVGSTRDRVKYGMGRHNGKPIFGHDTPGERDESAAAIGKETKAKKRKKKLTKRRPAALLSADETTPDLR